MTTKPTGPRDEATDRRRDATQVARHPATRTPATEDWDRARMLPRLIPVGQEELADVSPEGRRGILRRLAEALRGERRRGRAGHWSYSLDRHIGLFQALAAERRLDATGSRSPGARRDRDRVS